MSATKSAGKSESLLRLPNENFGVLQPFLPDTPWTTLTQHVLQQKRGEAFVDSAQSPRNVVVTARGNGDRAAPDIAFLFGKPTADGIQSYVSGVTRPTEFVCDEDMSPVVHQHHPDAQPRESVVVWFDYLDIEVDHEPLAGVRRLRSSDAVLVQRILPPRHFRTYPDAKAMITGGVVYGAFDGDDLVSLAYVPDHSVKFERIATFTAPPHRRQGLGFAVTTRLIDSCGTRGRIPCALIPRQSVAGWELARKVGFPRQALVTSYRTA